VLTVTHSVGARVPRRLSRTVTELSRSNQRKGRFRGSLPRPTCSRPSYLQPPLFRVDFQLLRRVHSSSSRFSARRGAELARNFSEL